MTNTSYLTRFLITSLLIVTFSSCISSKKIDKFVDNYYTEYPIEIDTNQIRSHWWSVSNTSFKIDTFSVSKKTKSYFLPGIVFWDWNKKIHTTLSTDIANNRFQNYLSSNSSSLKKALSGNNISFSFEKTPNEFSYNYRGTVIILLLFYFVDEVCEILPQESSYILNYSVTDSQGKNIKNGQVDLANNAKPVKKVWESSKSFTWYYLDNHQKHQDSAFADLLNKVEIELKNK